MRGQVRDPAVTVTRSSSNASSVSFLSSHHSDDSLLEESEIYEPSIEEWAPSVREGPERPERRYFDVGDDGESFGEVESFEEGDESEISTSSFTSSLETSSLETSTPPTPTPQTTATPSPITPVNAFPESIATTSSLSTPTVRPAPALPEISLDNLMGSLRGQLNDIRDQLSALRDGQGSTSRALDTLRSQPPPPPPNNTELSDRLGRIEDLIRDLVDMPHRQTVVAEPPPPRIPTESEPTESVITTSDSLGEFRDQLEGFAPGRPPLRMPIPSQAMPSILQQLQESILSGLPATTANRPPPLQPFVFEPRQSRPRSSSPLSFLETLQPRPYTAPSIDFTYSDPRGVPSRPTRRGPRQSRPTSDDNEDIFRNVPPSSHHGVFIPPRHIHEVESLTRRPPPPTPRPIFVRILIQFDADFSADIIFQPPINVPGSAPPQLGGDGSRPRQRWYLPAQPVSSISVSLVRST